MEWKQIDQDTFTIKNLIKKRLANGESLYFETKEYYAAQSGYGKVKSYSQKKIGSTGVKKDELLEEFLDYDSDFLNGRTYDRATGILVIYFNSFNTNSKAPVVLGIGKRVPVSFVRSLDAGIYAKTTGKINSNGAFYYKYIRQYIVVRINDTTLWYKPNPDRIVDAVSLDALIDFSEKEEDEDKEFKEWKKYFREVLSSRERTLFADGKWFDKEVQRFVSQQAKRFLQGKSKQAIASIKRHYIRKARKYVAEAVNKKYGKFDPKSGKQAMIYRAKVIQDGFISASDSSVKRSLNKIFATSASNAIRSLPSMKEGPEAYAATFARKEAKSVKTSIIKNGLKFGQSVQQGYYLYKRLKYFYSIIQNDKVGPLVAEYVKTKLTLDIRNDIALRKAKIREDLKQKRKEARNELQKQHDIKMRAVYDEWVKQNNQL